jgi:hypothetical protein
MRILSTVFIVASLGCGHGSTGPSSRTATAPILSQPSEDRSCLENGKTRVEGVSAEDVTAIRVAVGGRTSQPIMSIVRRGSAVEVETGTACGELSGGGYVFTLEREAGQWRIVQRERWISKSGKPSNCALQRTGLRPAAERDNVGRTYGASASRGPRRRRAPQTARTITLSSSNVK